jgi:hypothetical protein
MMDHKQQRGRRAVLIGLALFLVGQVAVARAVLWDNSLRDQDYAHKLALLRARLAASPRPLTVVQVGSSRTVFGLRGGEAEPWLSERLGRPVVLFNMGFTSSGPIGNLRTFQRLLDDGIRPDLLLVEIMPPFLTIQCSNCEFAPDHFAASRLGFPEVQAMRRHGPRFRGALEQEWWPAWGVSVYTYRFPLLTRLVPAILPPSLTEGPMTTVDASGWLQLRRLVPDQDLRCLPQARASYYPLMQDFWVGPEEVGAVRETVERARQEGIAVAMVLMPEGPIFRSWYTAATRKKMARALSWLRSEQGVPVFDLRRGLPEKAFCDSHHLYPEGAGRFTRRLAACIEPLLREIE